MPIKILLHYNIFTEIKITKYRQIFHISHEKENLEIKFPQQSLVNINLSVVLDVLVKKIDLNGTIMHLSCPKLSKFLLKALSTDVSYGVTCTYLQFLAFLYPRSVRWS